MLSPYHHYGYGYGYYGHGGYGYGGGGGGGGDGGGEAVAGISGDSYEIESSMNRYETSSAFYTPKIADAAWPLLLRVHNATVFSANSGPNSPKNSPGGPVFLNVYTDAGSASRAAGGWLVSIGVIGLGVAVLVALCRSLSQLTHVGMLRAGT